jgi:dGTP triphosphohydrolase
VLCQLVDEGGAEGFEGNAQSFRIVTRLASHADDDRDDRGGMTGNVGLNLTRATLNALLKYPWCRAPCGRRHRKWGAYRIDKERFDWAPHTEVRTERRPSPLSWVRLACIPLVPLRRVWAWRSYIASFRMWKASAVSLSVSPSAS